MSLPDAAKMASYGTGLLSIGTILGCIARPWLAEQLGRRRRRQRYLGTRPRIDVAGRVTIVIDDGIATGATTRAALRATRMRNPSKLVLAVPVAPTDSLAAMRQEADDVVCLEDHEFFGAIGLYYSDFRQISDQEVIDAMARFPVRAEGRTAESAAEMTTSPAVATSNSW